VSTEATHDASLAALPHREPFLFVTRVVERTERSIVTEWRVPPDADFFRGHYPGRPIVPGVLLCESAFQTGALLCASEASDELARGALPVLTRIGDARFKRAVAPGETLRCEVALDERVGPARYMKAKTTCGGELVLRVEFVVAVTDPHAERPA
jgi:3-hydroxyacyl-[acyl-carrier-protein] dehydratase